MRYEKWDEHFVTVKWHNCFDITVSSNAHFLPKLILTICFKFPKKKEKKHKLTLVKHFLFFLDFVFLKKLKIWENVWMKSWNLLNLISLWFKDWKVRKSSQDNAWCRGSTAPAKDHLQASLGQRWTQSSANAFCSLGLEQQKGIKTKCRRSTSIYQSHTQGEELRIRQFVVVFFLIL